MKGRDKSVKVTTPLPVVEVVPPLTRAEKVNGILRGVEEKVAGLIDNAQVTVSAHKMPFVEPPKDDSKQLTLRLKAVQQTRDKMKSRLQEIAVQERQLKSKQKHSGEQGDRQRSVSPLTVKTKSQLSEQDILLLKRLKREQRDFQKSLESKSSEYNLKLEELRKQEEQLRDRQKREGAQARKKQIEQRLQAIGKQRIEKQKQFEEEKRKMVELKAKKKLYQEVETRYKETERSELERKVTAMEERMRSEKVDVQGLRQHEEKYKQLKSQQRAQRERRKEELQELARERKGQNFEKSKFYTLIVTENKRRKEEEQGRQRERLGLVEAAREYAQIVKREHIPRVKTRSSESDKEKEKIQGLSFEQTKEMGNNYFEQMKQVLKKPNANTTINNDSSSLTHSNTTTPQPLRTLSTKYKDYLSERRQHTKRSKLSDKMNLTGDSRIRNIGIRRELEQACRLAGSSSRQEGLERLRAIAGRLEIDRGGEDHHILDKIAAKLRILQTLTNH